RICFPPPASRTMIALYQNGPMSYSSGHYPEYTDQVLAIVDMAEPTRPEVVGKWWIPGMWTGGGETPSWPKSRRYALHHALSPATSPMAPAATAGSPCSMS